MEKLIINNELKNLLPPLSEEEAAELEASILQYGCLTPLVTWNNILVDGYYRYEICTKHCIPFSVQTIHLLNLEDAKLWAWRHQGHRRNLTLFQRGEIALKLKEIIAAKAKKNQGIGITQSKETAERDPIETRKVLGEMADVSNGTLGKVEFLMKHAGPEVKERLRRSEKGTSIHREYCRLKSESSDAPRSAATATVSDRKIIMDEETGMLRIRNDVASEELAALLVDNFSIEYIRDLAHALLKQFEHRYGQEVAQHFLLKIWAEHID